MKKTNCTNIERAQYALGPFAEVPSGAWTPLPWSEQTAPDHPLDLADPLNPVATVAGVFTVTATGVRPLTDPLNEWVLDVELDVADGDATAVATMPAGAGTAKAPPVTVAYFVPVGGVISVQVHHTAGVPVAFSGNTIVVFQPGTVA